MQSFKLHGQYISGTQQSLQQRPLYIIPESPQLDDNKFPCWKMNKANWEEFKLQYYQKKLIQDLLDY